MRIAICDDQPLMCKETEKYLSEYSTQYQYKVDIEVFFSGASLLFSNTSFDIVFLDIEMEKENGIEIAEQYSKVQKGRIIFLTSHVEEMPNGYKVRAFRFLVKPIDRALFFEAVESAAKEIAMDKQIMVQEEGMEFFIHCSDIIYVEAGARSCGVRTAEGFFRSTKNIETMRRELDTPNFFSTHRSYIVNMDHVDIHALRKNGLTMCNNEIVKVSRLKNKEFKDTFFTYIKSK